MNLPEIKCWKDTQDICNKYVPRPPKSIKYKYKYILCPKKYKYTSLSIRNEDSIECGMSQLDNNPVILTMVNDVIPGGNIELGNRGLEESVFRRTNSFQTLHKSMYPINYDELIYSPDVSVIKTLHWEYIYTPRKVSFISCPGLSNPVLINGYLSTDDIKLLTSKIHHILQTAIYHKHDTIIIGEMGCITHNNQSYQIAYIFKKVILEYNGLFKHIIFAVSGDTYNKFIDIFKIDN